ncbi:flavin reductase family protein [Erythrobacter litoralis]|uniref:NADH:riboflavin 5'-phosphate oxidoreductase n=1 Tax=Erythrobacter litoralis (strain HTCC2594) TaxID=314225 RepID=Q2N8Q5_ERYLH|nr:flavin reductase family protein [Erythrobacter litoralis]ABC63936.1 NADH:riboflavin 5'-phosphate oxidoreductase [Erythrobacter litoralis HTCC2594]
MSKPRTVTFRAGDDTRALRDAFGCFATGVTILTTTATDGAPVGLTVSSFSSVSLDPPLLLVCPALDAGSTAALEGAKRFAVNVLASEDKALSSRFARKGLDRFVENEWHRSEHGLPLLDRALATFECERHAVHDGGDHLILVGRILRAVCHPHDDPLLYFRSRYRGIHIED